MPDCVLPSRNEVQRSDLDIAEPAFSIVAAYLDDELKTEPEWREAIDYEAAGAVMEDWAEYLEDKAGRWAATVEAVDAALPDQEV